jgi:hypothetical protein
MDVIQGLWWGPLTNLERLSAASYIANGHPYHLYTYQTLGGIPNPPDGVVLKDAEEIIPASVVSMYRYLANFADWFRVNLLYKRGGWWCDADSVCLRPFDFPGDTTLVRHIRPPDREGELCMFNAHMKFPAGAPALAWAIQEMKAVDQNNAHWEYALEILTRAALKFDLTWQPARLFIPLPWWEWSKQLEATPPEIPIETYAVHLWHTEWTMSRLNRDAHYAPTSLYETLKGRYHVG